jgi:hypothetical protein
MNEWNEADGNPYDPDHPFIAPSEVVERTSVTIWRASDPHGYSPDGPTFEV